MPADLASIARLPRVAFEARRPPLAVEPLRTDVAGVIVASTRGPVAAGVTAVQPEAGTRVEGWREFERIFGGADGGTASCHAVRGYFDNGGEVLWVIRVAAKAQTASIVFELGAAAGLLGSSPPEEPPILAQSFLVTGTSPGAWANGLEVRLRLRRGGTPAGRELADLEIRRGGERIEHLLSLDPTRLVEDVARLSTYVRFAVEKATTVRSPAGDREFVILATLDNGRDDPPDLDHYERAAKALAEEPEPAILFAPDAWIHLGDAADGFYRRWADRAARAMDRLVLVDPVPCPTGHRLRDQAVRLRDAPERDALEPRYLAAMALYYPCLRIPDPQGSALRPLRSLPPSGHVAGVISRMDRERGAHHTAANAEIVGAVDLERDYDEAERAVLHPEGLNALRCARGRGVEIWGGRTLDAEPRRFLAHRRLIHRLVRAMRRVAEPLVFAANTPNLRFTLVRAITSVLLEAFRAGALKGSRPDEAFQVVCDDRTNPPDAYDTGFCVAEVGLAPAYPMEFITLIVSLSHDGSLEVLE
jgi:hypothetical protein